MMLASTLTARYHEFHCYLRTSESFKISGDGGIRTNGAPSRCSGAVLVKALKLLVSSSAEVVILTL